MNAGQLLQLAPGLTPDRAAVFVPALEAAMVRFLIATPRQRAHFVAQVLHESGNLARMTENLNYTPQGLLATFGHHFTVDQAQQYGRTLFRPADQEAIANLAYANRLGNGDAASGDGWRYRGRGPLQMTGKANYLRCGNALGIDLVAQPDQVARPDVGCLAAGWFWSIGNPLGHTLNGLAEAGEVDAISRAINGGNNGLAERAALTRKTLEVLA